MTTTNNPPVPAAASAGAGEHVDVVVVGAGLSGVGAAYRLQTERPGTSYVVLVVLEAGGPARGFPTTRRADCGQPVG